MKNVLSKNHSKSGGSSKISMLFLVIAGSFIFLFPVWTSAQTFEFRRIAAGADTAELYLKTLWYNSPEELIGGIFRSTDHGQTLSVQFAEPWPTGPIVYGNIYGDAIPGSVYSICGGLYVSHDFGTTWEYKETPLTYSFDEGTGGCLAGEVYISGCVVPEQKALYHGLFYGDSLYLIRVQNDSLFCFESGSLPGELYALKWPYWDPFRDTLALAFSNDFGQTFTVNYIDTSIATHLFQHTLAHGPDTGELYVVGLDANNRYHVLHSWDYGQTFALKYLFQATGDPYSFVAGKNPGTFYFTRTFFCSAFPYYCLEIHYSQDWGETYTVYYHELSNAHTGIPPGFSPTTTYSIYPNPASDKLTVEFSENEGGINIQLIDITGRLQKSISLPQGQRKHQVDVQAMRPGVYFLKVMVGQQVIGVEKVVVGR